MKDRIRNLSIWVGGLVISLFFFMIILSSSGSGMGLFKWYFPFVAKDYPPTPTPITPTPVGPVGGTFTALVVDPNQSQTLLAGSYVSGVYKTYDQGDTWYRQNAGLGNLKIQSLAYHPTISNIVYAGTYSGGIYKSSNGGNSWTASNGGVLGNHIVYDIEIDPKNGNVIYAATRINGSLRGYLYKSSNAGASWNLLLTGDAFSTLDYFYDIDVNPLNSNELYLTAHEHGFYKSTDAGATFYPINSGVSDLSARSFALDSAYSGLVYGAVWHDDAVYRTWNSGYSWANSRVGLPTNTAVFRLYADPFGGTQKRVFACTYGNGLYSTDNFAQSWSSRGLAGQRLYDFVVANGSPQRWFAATESNGVFRTNAGSSSWSNIMGELRLNAVTDLLKDDLNETAYVAVYGKGVYAVDSSGLSWVELTQDLEDRAVLDLEIAQGKLHILTESALYTLEGENWLPIDLPTIEGDKGEEAMDILSEKVGLPGEVLADHMEQAQVNLSLNSNNLTPVLPIRLFAEKDILYVGTIGNGLYMRVANEWKQVGLEGKSVIDFAFDNATNDLFVIACDSDDVCAVFISKGGEWSLLQYTPQDLKVNKLLETGNGLLAATSLGIYWIDPDSQQWIMLGGHDKSILSLTATGDCLMAAAGQGFVLQSSDCGETWQEQILEDWHYQTIGFLGEQNERLLLGSQEAGALILPLH